MITQYWLGDTLFWKFSIEQHMYAQYQRCTPQLLKKLEFIQNISFKVVVVLSLVQNGQIKHFKEMYTCSPYLQCSCWLSCNDLLTNIPIVFSEWNTLFMRKKIFTIRLIHLQSLRTLNVHLVFSVRNHPNVKPCRVSVDTWNIIIRLLTCNFI